MRRRDPKIGHPKIGPAGRKEAELQTKLALASAAGQLDPCCDAHLSTEV